MKILIATHNQAKFERYSQIINAISGLEFFSLSDLGITYKVEENHATNIENATHKARTYGKMSGLITVAVDEALMTNFLPDNEQPGVYARRFAKDKKELSDAELLDVWREIFKIYPQSNKKFIWNFAVAYYNPSNDSCGVECIEEISYVARYFSSIKINGYPMSSFLSFKSGGIPYAEVTQGEKEGKDVKNFANFVNILRAWLLNNN